MTEIALSTGCPVCEVEAGEHCLPTCGWVLAEPHTYVTHLQFSALDDEHARRISALIVNVITQYQASIDADSDAPEFLLAQGYAIEAAHLTDADDWAEHVGQEDVCFQCGRSGGTNRLRHGGGSRVCMTCVVERRLHAYPIEEVLI